jgi:hypothetical protein
MSGFRDLKREMIVRRYLFPLQRTQFDNWLDAGGLYDWMSRMRITILLGLMATLIISTGCVSTASGTKTAAVPLVRDSVEGRYERPVPQVYEAAKEVMRFNGQLTREVTRYTDDGVTVMALEGMVQDRKIFMGVKQEDQSVTSIKVQVRTSAGGTDLSLAHELEKQVALKLVR